MSIGISRQLWIEEGGLVEVLPHLDLFFLHVSPGFRICISLHSLGLGRFFSHLGIGHRCLHGHSLVEHHAILRDSRPASAEHGTTGETTETVIIGTGIDIMVEVTELQFCHISGTPMMRGHVAYLMIGGIDPCSGRHRQVDIGYQRPRVRLQHVEALIVERCHELSIDGFALAVFHRQCPLFLLPRLQPVTEGSPCQREVLVRQRALNLCRVSVAFAILHPGESQQQTIAIRLFIGEFLVQELIAPVDRSTLDQLIAREDAVHDMHILV